MRALRIIVPGLMIVFILAFYWNSRNEPPSAAAAIPAPAVATPSAVVPPLPVEPADSELAPVAPSLTAPPRTEESRRASRRNFSNPLESSAQAAPRPARAVESVDPEAAVDFDKVSLMLRNYRTLTGENPVGTNAEIMKSVMIDNPKGAQLGPPDGQSLNATGELLDRWGTPYFFHQLTKDRMEIISAGPDLKLWNEDDLVGE